MNFVTSMLRCFAVIGFIACLASLAAGVCPVVPAAERKDCGSVTTTRDQCLLKTDCCWDETMTAGTIWCYYKPNITSGSNYVRWGRTTCDGDAIVLYKGHVAGPIWNQPGGGSNYLCLHEDPLWGNTAPGISYPSASIFGTVYDTFQGAANIFSTANNNGQSLFNKPAPCVRCYAPNRFDSFMVAARNVCPTGWTKEYDGYIVTSYYNHYRNEHTCWDSAPETTTGTFDQNKSTFYPTEINCGNLPCSPYTQGNELTCAVCTK